VTALLTFKSVSLTSSVVISGGAIKGTVQGILDNNDLIENKKVKIRTLLTFSKKRIQRIKTI